MATNAPVKKNEGGGDIDIDENEPIVAMKKQKKVESDDEDEVPLAVARASKKSAVAAASSKVKKEETNGDDKSGVLKKKNVMKNTKISKVKKLDYEDEKETKKKIIKKVEIKGKENKKQKKSYDLPGQKHDPPEERDPLRIFYESLYNQIPTSEMASFWMMERGLLEETEAKRVFEKKRQKSGFIASPIKPITKKSTSKGKIVNSNNDKGKIVKKRKMDESDEDSDDDFIASRKVSASKKLKV